MIVLGLLILAAATALGVETVLATRGTDATFTIWSETFTASVAVWFLVGAVVMACALLGLFLVTGSLQRRRRVSVVAKHRERDVHMEDLLENTDRTNAELVEENDRLRNELAAERRSAATLGGVAVPPGVGDVPYGDQVGDAVRSDTIATTGHYDPYPGEQQPQIVMPDVSEEKADVIGRFRGKR